MSSPSMDINVREQALPGVGQRFEIELFDELRSLGKPSLL